MYVCGNLLSGVQTSAHVRPCGSNICFSWEGPRPRNLRLPAAGLLCASWTFSPTLCLPRETNSPDVAWVCLPRAGAQAGLPGRGPSAWNRGLWVFEAVNLGFRQAAAEPHVRCPGRARTVLSSRN